MLWAVNQAHENAESQACRNRREGGSRIKAELPVLKTTLVKWLMYARGQRLQVRRDCANHQSKKLEG